MKKQLAAKNAKTREGRKNKSEARSTKSETNSKYKGPKFKTKKQCHGRTRTFTDRKRKVAAKYAKGREVQSPIDSTD